MTNLDIHFIRQFTVWIHDRIHRLWSVFCGHVSSKLLVTCHVRLFSEGQVAEPVSGTAVQVDAQRQHS